MSKKKGPSVLRLLLVISGLSIIGAMYLLSCGEVNNVPLPTNSPTAEPTKKPTAAPVPTEKPIATPVPTLMLFQITYDWEGTTFTIRFRDARNSKPEALDAPGGPIDCIIGSIDWIKTIPGTIHDSCETVLPRGLEITIDNGASSSFTATNGNSMRVNAICTNDGVIIGECMKQMALMTIYTQRNISVSTRSPVKTLPELVEGRRNFSISGKKGNLFAQSGNSSMAFWFKQMIQYSNQQHVA